MGSQKFTIRSNLETAAHNPFAPLGSAVAPSFGTTASTCPALALAFVVAVPFFGTLGLNRAVDSAAPLKRLHNTSPRSLPEIILYPDATSSDRPLSGGPGPWRYEARSLDPLGGQHVHKTVKFGMRRIQPLSLLSGRPCAVIRNNYLKRVQRWLLALSSPSRFGTLG